MEQMKQSFRPLFLQCQTTGYQHQLDGCPTEGNRQVVSGCQVQGSSSVCGCVPGTTEPLRSSIAYVNATTGRIDTAAVRPTAALPPPERAAAALSREATRASLLSTYTAV